MKPLYGWEMGPQYLLDGLQNQTGCGGEHLPFGTDQAVMAFKNDVITYLTMLYQLLR